MSSHLDRNTHSYKTHIKSLEDGCHAQRDHRIVAQRIPRAVKHTVNLLVMRSKPALLGNRQIHIGNSFRKGLESRQFTLHQERRIVHLRTTISKNGSGLLTSSRGLNNRSSVNHRLRVVVQGHRGRRTLKRRRFGRLHRGNGGRRGGRRVGAVVLALARIANTTLTMAFSKRILTTHTNTTVRTRTNVHSLEAAHSGNVHLDLTLQLLLSSNIGRVLLARDTTFAKSKTTSITPGSRFLSNGGSRTFASA